MRFGVFSSPVNKGKGVHLARKALDQSPEVKGIFCHHPYEVTMKLMDKCDAVIVPSLGYPEPLSRVLLEALKRGKAVIGYQTGGNSDAIKDEKNGYLINWDTDWCVENLSNAIIRMKKTYKRMGLESRKLYEKKFHPDIVIKKIENEYKRLMK